MAAIIKMRVCCTPHANSFSTLCYRKSSIQQAKGRLKSFAWKTNDGSALSPTSPSSSSKAQKKSSSDIWKFQITLWFNILCCVSILQTEVKSLQIRPFAIQIFEKRCQQMIRYMPKWLSWFGKYTHPIIFYLFYIFVEKVKKQLHVICFVHFYGTYTTCQKGRSDGRTLRKAYFWPLKIVFDDSDSSSSCKNLFLFTTKWVTLDTFVQKKVKSTFFLSKTRPSLAPALPS